MIIAAVRICIGLLIIFLGTQISIQVNLLYDSIPITGQTLTILAVAYVLGCKEGTMTTFLYLLIGLLGVPVFANGGNGFDAFTGNSAGFLFGFLFGAFATGLFSDKYKNSLKNALLATFYGTIIIMSFGVIYLSFKLNFEQALIYGFYPFWIAAIVKIVIGGILAYLIKKYLIPFPIQISS